MYQSVMVAMLDGICYDEPEISIHSGIYICQLLCDISMFLEIILMLMYVSNLLHDWYIMITDEA